MKGESEEAGSLDYRVDGVPRPLIGRAPRPNLRSGHLHPPSGNSGSDPRRPHPERRVQRDRKALTAETLRPPWEPLGAAKWLRARARIDECGVSHPGSGWRSGICRIKPLEDSRELRRVCHKLLTLLCRPFVLGGQHQTTHMKGEHAGGPRLRGGMATTCVAADRMDSGELGPSPDGGMGSRAPENGGRGPWPRVARKQHVISEARKGYKVVRIGQNPLGTHLISQIL